MEKLKEMLVELANRVELNLFTDNVYEASGGNIDDAYRLGFSDGEAALAKKLCKKLYNLNITPAEETEEDIYG